MLLLWNSCWCGFKTAIPRSSPKCDHLHVTLIQLALWKGTRKAPSWDTSWEMLGGDRYTGGERWLTGLQQHSPLRYHSCRAEALQVTHHLHSCKQHQYWSVQIWTCRKMLLACLYLLQLWTAMAFSGSHPASILPQNLTLALVDTLSTATFSWLLSSLLLDFVPFCFRSFTQNPLSKPPPHHPSRSLSILLIVFLTNTMLICSHTSCIPWQNRYTGYLSIVSKYYNQGILELIGLMVPEVSLDGGANAR